MRDHSAAVHEREELCNEEAVEENKAYAAENRQIFRKMGVFVLNMMGAPGSGKTRMLQNMLPLLQQHIHVAVIEADLTRGKDARRIAGSGVSVVQIDAGSSGHLDAQMINRVLSGFYLEDIEMLIIENMGSLVCPAAFDLGEDQRMVVMSITEGEDKPGKYPAAFLSSQLAVINKADLCDELDINIAAMHRDICAINPQIKVFTTCCRLGEVLGVDALAAYLLGQAKEKIRNKD